MAYKACFQCELLFEVEEDTSTLCPQCGGALCDYEPDEEELDDALFDDDVTRVGEVDPSIVATVAFDGLAEAVREKLAAHVEAPTLEAPTATGPQQVIAQRPPAGRATTPEPVTRATSPSTGGGRTRVLDAIQDEVTPPSRPARALHTPIPDALDSVPAARAAPPEPGRARFGEGADRRTRLENLDELQSAPPPPQITVAPPVSKPAVPVAERVRPAPIVAHRPVEDAQPTLHVMPGARPRSRLPLVAAGALALAVVVGLAVWLGGSGEAPPVEISADASAPPTPPSWRDRLTKQLRDGQALLPVVRGSVALTEGPYIAGGAEGLSSSQGVVPGFPSTAVPDTIVDSDARGEWIRPLLAGLRRQAMDTHATLALALDGGVPVRDLLRVAYSGERAGFRRFALVASRAEGAGSLGALPFTLRGRADPLPRAGALVVRVGRIGFHVSVRDAEGHALSADPPTLPRLSDGALDMPSFEQRLDRLRAAHPDTNVAVIHPIPDMSLEQLAGVMARVASGPEGPRYGTLSLVLR